LKNVVFALLILCVCGVGGVKFYLPKLIDERVDKRVSDRISDATAIIQKQHDQLAEIVKNLESRQQSLGNTSTEHKAVTNFKVDFKRWDCWCDLKNKLRHGNEYSEELAKFHNMFSDCPDLLKMIDSLVPDKKIETKDDSLINNLLEFVKIHGINESDLERITGYVLLLSIRKVETDE
jgi:hypothetical protein